MIEIWNSVLKKYFIYFDNCYGFFKYLDDNHRDMFFILSSSFNSLCDYPRNALEENAFKCHTDFTITDSNHLIAVGKNTLYGIYIDYKFFIDNMDKFIDYSTNKIKNSLINDDVYINVPDFIMRDNLFTEIFYELGFDYQKDDIIKELSNHIIKYYSIMGNDLLECDKRKIRDNNMTFVYYRDGIMTKISDRYVIDNYSLWDLSKIDKITIKKIYSDDEIGYLRYIKKDAIISFDIIKELYGDEFGYFEYIKKVISILSKYDRDFILDFRVDNREIFKNSKLLDSKRDNIKIYIYCDEYIYTEDEYVYINSRLDEIVDEFKDKKLSNLEKYLVVYNIVKNYKEYKDCSDKPAEARLINYILDNDYMVCVGFSRLLKVLLDKLGIPCQCISLMVDVSDYEKGDLITKLSGHQRNIVKIDDDKYNVHGIYLVDATWDNNPDKDIYLNCLVTFDRKKEDMKLESISSFDYLMDFHDREDFNEKVNSFIKRIFSCNNHNSNCNNVNDVCRSIYYLIMDYFIDLDCEMFRKIHIMYGDKIKKINLFSEDMAGKIMQEFLNEYASYIIPLVNNEIDDSIIYNAIRSIYIKVYGYSLNDANREIKKIIEYNKDIENIQYPYRYDYKIKRLEYLDSRK